MPSLTIKGIPEDVVERLRRSAAAHRRSLNSEVIHRLERSIGKEPPDPDEFLARLREIQARTKMTPLTDELLDQARREGRP